MSCELCESSMGLYDFKRVCCCARLVRDSRPNRQRQEAMLEVISRLQGAPSKEEILARVRVFGEDKT